MPDLDSFRDRSPKPTLNTSSPDLTFSRPESGKPDFSTQDPDSLVLPQRLPQHTKDLPLTDIGTSPPAFEINSLTHKGSRDSYESSELSDLDDDGSEAETDKMDFLNDDNSSSRDKVSDLQALSELTELARLQGVDSDDSDDNFPKNISHEDALQLNGKHELDEDDERPKKHARVVKHEQESEEVDEVDEVDEGERNGDHSESSTRSAASPAISEAIERETAEVIRHTSPDKEVKKEVSDNEDGSENEGEDGEKLSENGKIDEKVQNGSADADPEANASEDAEADPEAAEDETMEKAEDAEDVEEEEAEEAEAEDAEADVEDTEKQEEEEAEKASKAEAEKIDQASIKEHQIAEENDVNMDEHRKLAVDELILIETDFAHLRDKLYQDKLSLLEHEVQLCLDGLHPELLQIYLKVNEFYQDNIRLANAILNYSLKCINNETIASRTAIHQNFMKDIMDMKNDMITETTLQWYKINKERNILDQLVPDFNFTALPTIPVLEEARGYSQPIAPGGSSVEYYMDAPVLSKKTIKQNTLYELVQQRNSLNEELGILNGLSEFYGFPCAISNALHKDDSESVAVEELIIRKATNDEVEEDLRAMGISTS